MDFDLPPTIPVSGIPWERVLPPLLPRSGGTFGSYPWTPAELLVPVKEHTGAAQVGETAHFHSLRMQSEHGHVGKPFRIISPAMYMY